MNDYHIPLIADQFYHLFNRAVGSDKLFREDENYNYFLGKFKQYILPVADVFAYSLLPNHFHLLIRIKTDRELMDHFLLKKRKAFNEQFDSLPGFVMEQFSNWLNGYAKAFNKMYNRKGSLFIDYLKRSEAKEDSDITSFIFYIHKNAVHHGLTKKIGEWSYDSYKSIISSLPTSLKRNEVVDWFGSIEQFIRFHSQPIELKFPELESGL
ncbi:MAG: hypothetical protein JST43_02670 [Bacteroidetes bacterium]|nr:hypothetical protein [Bacteroidota bacterium]MBS1540368.1 hypothetical protein [Bacteroidota bacterium]